MDSALRPAHDRRFSGSPRRRERAQPHWPNRGARDIVTGKVNFPADTLKGKTAFITGGSSGIGRATAVTFAKAGARVAILSRTQDELRDAADEIEKAGGEALVVAGDVSDASSIEAAVDQIASRWGWLDIAFANAGINGVWAPLDELSCADWTTTIAINLTGTFITIKASLPLLKKQGGAVIITSSVNGTRMFSNTGASAYATSKAGQVALGRMLALELAAFRIRVNTICPGAIATSIDESTDARDLEHIRLPIKFPEGKIPLTHGEPGTAEQVAETVLFLASDAASHITGTEIFIDGAQSLFQG